jgi:hypothetical protein
VAARCSGCERQHLAESRVGRRRIALFERRVSVAQQRRDHRRQARFDGRGTHQGRAIGVLRSAKTLLAIGLLAFTQRFHEAMHATAIPALGLDGRQLLDPREAGAQQNLGGAARGRVALFVGGERRGRCVMFDGGRRGERRCGRRDGRRPTRQR